MKEIIELRIYKKYAHLLLNPGEGKDLGLYVAVNLTKDDPRYKKVSILTKEIRDKYNDFFFLYSEIKRKYNKKELDIASLLHMKIRTRFEPTGEECGTLYDESIACEICGANRKQEGPLILKKGSIPKKDISKTIAGEIVISEKFAVALKKRALRGGILEPVIFEKGPLHYYQLTASTEVDLSEQTVSGINLFDMSTSNEGEIYKCPKGHTIGLNLLSEPYVLNNPSINEYDFIASKQKIGVRRGLLRPEPLYFCSPAFRKMIEEERLSGFDFEIAHIEADKK